MRKQAKKISKKFLKKIISNNKMIDFIPNPVCVAVRVKGKILHVLK